jgi:hypothetical protein
MPVSAPGRFTWLVFSIGLILIALFHLVGGSLPDIVTWIWLGVIGILILLGK